MGPENRFSVKLEDIKSDEVDEDDIPLVLWNENHDFDSTSVIESGVKLVSFSFYFYSTEALFIYLFINLFVLAFIKSFDYAFFIYLGPSCLC